MGVTLNGIKFKLIVDNLSLHIRGKFKLPAKMRPDFPNDFFSLIGQNGFKKAFGEKFFGKRVCIVIFKHCKALGYFPPRRT